MPQTIAPPDLDRLDLDEIKRFLARRWGLILTTALGCVILAGVVCFSMTPVYTATTQILLDPRKQHIFGQDAVNPDSALDSSIVDSQIPIILSTRLLGKVVAHEDLANDPEFSAPAHQGLLDRLFGFLRPATKPKTDVPSLDGIDPALAPVILHLFNKVDVTRVAKSYVLSLSVSSRDPAKATRLANALAQTYVEDQIDVHAKSVQQAAAFFEDRLGNLRDQVRQSERTVADYRRDHNLTTTTMDGKITVGEQQLQDLNEKLATSSADNAERLARFQQAERFEVKGANLETLPDVIRSPVIVQLRTQQADLTRREADLSAMYGPSYPAVTQIHAQRAGLDRAIAAEMRRLVATLKNDYEVAKAREDSMRKTIAALTDVSGGDNDVGVKLRELERTNLANKALFENFLNRAKLTQEQSTFEEPDARLISPALEPTTPSSPKTKLILGAAAVAGLLVGLGLAVLVDLMRAKTVVRRPVPVLAVPGETDLDDAAQPERAPRRGLLRPNFRWRGFNWRGFSRPIVSRAGGKRGASLAGKDADASARAFILGRVPDIAVRGGAVDCLAYMADHPQSVFARGIDDLAAQLTASSTGRGRVVSLASLSAGEGATSLAICIAAAAARTVDRVLLVDADASRRGLSAWFGSAGSAGFAEVIAGTIAVKAAVTRQGAFKLLPAGRVRLDAAAAAERIDAFFEEARTRFDVVLVDAGVFGAEAAAIGACSDGIALVTSRDHLLREEFIAAVDAVADERNFMGIILNRASEAEAADLSLSA